MSRAISFLIGFGLTASLGLTVACDPGPKCLHYDTQTSWAYVIGPKGTMTPHLIVTTVCTEYAKR